MWSSIINILNPHVAIADAIAEQERARVEIQQRSAKASLNHKETKSRIQSVRDSIHSAINKPPSDDRPR